ncbi:hypothetical protein GALL_466900 [mine drainage metagenome]|uniref:Uncharacterized protein n=1 Tax=mine drainage metagenome TaxID=410659 RepID=A0A1J5PJE7_9ZZZZ
MAVDGAPGHEALALGGQRPHAGRNAVADDQQGVGGEQVGDVVLVRLELVVGAPQVGVLVAGVFQLQHHQRQAVDEQHDVRAAVVLWPLHGELVDRQPVVAPHVGKVDEPHAVATGFAVLLVLHRHAFDQPAVDLPVGGDQPGGVWAEHPAQSLALGGGRKVRIEAANGGLQPVRQADLAVAVAFAAGCFGVGRGDVGAVGDLPAQRSEPLQGGLFEMVLEDGAAHGVRAEQNVGAATGPDAHFIRSIRSGQDVATLKARDWGFPVGRRLRRFVGAVCFLGFMETPSTPSDRRGRCVACALCERCARRLGCAGLSTDIPIGRAVSAAGA